MIEGYEYICCSCDLYFQQNICNDIDYCLTKKLKK